MNRMPGAMVYVMYCGYIILGALIFYGFLSFFGLGYDSAICSMDSVSFPSFQETSIELQNLLKATSVEITKIELDSQERMDSYCNLHYEVCWEKLCNEGYFVKRVQVSNPYWAEWVKK